MRLLSKPVKKVLLAITLSSISCPLLANHRDNPDSMMTISGLVNHLKMFQQIADRNDELPGTRFTNTKGFEQSRDYIIKTMRDAGYQVTVQNMPISIAYIKSPREFSMTRPTTKTFVDNEDYAPMINSGSGDIEGTVRQPVGDLTGCQKSSFSEVNAGDIALISFDGRCSRHEAITNAIQSGASAVIGYYPNVKGVMFVDAGETIPSETTPILIVNNEVANDFINSISKGAAPQVRIKFNMVKKFGSSQNIIAESKAGDPDHVVMMGAHYDSSGGNAGMNDNASSIATVLETALLMKDSQPANKLRFAFWTGEELGLRGSNYYVEHLNQEERAKIKVYFNYEILGAPNGGRFIMGSADGITPEGNKKVTQDYADYFKSQHLKYFTLDPRLGRAAERSDMAAFMAAGIPSGFLVTGSELPWNPMLSMIFTDLPNRRNGVATHPCYHRLCDQLTMKNDEMVDPNFDFDLYLQMSKAAAHLTYLYSMKTD